MAKEQSKHVQGLCKHKQLRLVVGILACLFFFSPQTSSAVDINTPIDGSDVYGNGTVGSTGVSGKTLNIYAAVTDGSAYGAKTTNGEVKNNSVTIESGGSVEYSAYGAYTSDGNAFENSVFLYGGNAYVENIYGGYTENGSSFGNIIIIDGGTVDGAIYGGRAAGSGTGAGYAIDNKIVIYGATDLSSASLVGGAGTNDIRSGNTLEIRTANLAVYSLKNFEKFHFYLPANLAANRTMLTVSNSAILGTFADVQVGVQGGGSSPLNVGDIITLIDASGPYGTLSGSIANAQTSGTGMVGISEGFSFDLDIDLAARKLIATVTASGRNDAIDAQLKSLVEARVSGIGMLTQGGDMLAGQAIPQLRLATLHGGGTVQSGLVPFGVVGGQALRYNSGSHVDVDGVNLVTGLGWSMPLNEGKNGALLLGALFEAGWGGYDSHNSFSGGSIKGDGDTNYYGAGILARYDSAPVGPGTAYLETSFRAGTVENDYSSSDFRNSTNTGKVTYDSSATYYGAHAGIGYIWNISDSSSLDMYTKYLWTRQDSDSVTIEGDSIRFKAMDSHRWRTGAKFSHALATDSGLVFTPYIGAAYEHEFDGKAKGAANGDAIDKPEITGGTGIGELGFAFKPSATSGLSLDLGVQGYTGKREGVGGSFQIKWEF